MRSSLPRAGSCLLAVHLGLFQAVATASAAVMVLNSTPLNQFLARHPDYFFEAPVEMGRINPDNLQILLSHVKCAAFELPLTHADREFWPGLIDETICELVRSDDLAVRRRSSGPIAVWTGNGWPAHSPTE